MKLCVSGDTASRLVINQPSRTVGGDSSPCHFKCGVTFYKTFNIYIYIL